ncbi:hypothetical protein AB0L85_02875 [Streptomyces sp. NPDC052051]|uniref:hypothetical protein n=1 Tax=Streptomyces sp. NPDC052051 TaxID=3154649 RepID=UPI003442C086
MRADEHGQPMNRQLETFIRTYLHMEMAYRTGGYLRPTLFGFSEFYVLHVREGLSQLLNSRSLSVEEYEGLSDIEFPGEDSLYEYLQSMYAYLFDDLPDQPMPPE